MAKLLLASLAVVLLTFASAEYDVEKICRLVTAGTKLASLDSCATYYTCLGASEPIKSSCAENQVFNKDAQSCVPAAEGNCYYGLSNPCINRHDEFAYCNKGCNWYNYCLNGKIFAAATCPANQIFYAANGSCIYGSCGSNERSGVPNVCEIIPEGVFFGDSENCRAWHRCVGMNQESGLCDNSLVYDVSSGYCLQNSGNICQKADQMIPGEPSGPPEVPCTNVSQAVGDTNVCSLHYVCKVASQLPVVTYQWVQKNCGTQYFDVISQTCSDPSKARAYPGCDRCQAKASYTGTYWVNAVDPECALYFTCRAGSKTGTGLRACAEGSFYNEIAQACIGAEENLAEYAENNGSCQNYTCNERRECSLAEDPEENKTTTEPSTTAEA